MGGTYYQAIPLKSDSLINWAAKENYIYRLFDGLVSSDLFITRNDVFLGSCAKRSGFINTQLHVHSFIS